MVSGWTLNTMVATVAINGTKKARVRRITGSARRSSLNGMRPKDPRKAARNPIPVSARG